MSEDHRAEHDILGKLLRLGFDHQNAIDRAGDNEVEPRARSFGECRVQDIIPVDVAHPSPGDRSQERYPRDGQSRRGADHRRDVGIVLEIVAEDGANDLSFIDETRNEKRAQRPVDEPRDQRLLFRRAPLAFEKASGDLSGCKRLLLVINREREEVLTGLCRFHRDRSAQDRGLAVGGEHGAVRLPG